MVRKICPDIYFQYWFLGGLAFFFVWPIHGDSQFLSDKIVSLDATKISVLQDA